MSRSIIELSNLSKEYETEAGSTQALRNLNLDIAAGQFVSLMGPSGSGKTTLLNLIAGLDAPTGGVVCIEGSDLSKLADNELADLRLRTIGFVFQTFNLIPALTVLENVSWPLEFSGYSRTEVRRRAQHALERVAVMNRGQSYPAELSGGEQQRVAIARAIATRPAILLADEPTGNLDSRTGQSILDLLRDLNASEGATVVMVTHDVFAAAYGHRTLEIQDGAIVRDIRTPTDQTTTVTPADFRFQQ